MPVVQELSTLLRVGVMEVRRDWNDGLPVLSMCLGADDFANSAVDFRNALNLAKRHGLEPQAYWTEGDPPEDPEALLDAEISIEYALNTIDERLEEMKRSGLYDF